MAKWAKISRQDVEVYDFIRAYKIMHGGNTPPLKEIANNTSTVSESAAHYSIQKLRDAGHIIIEPSFNVRMPGDGWRDPTSESDRPRIGELVSEDEENAS